MSFAKVLNLIILLLFLIGAALLVSLEVNTVRRSILDQMQANLETSTTALGLVLQGTLLNGDKVLSETIINAMFDGSFVNSATLIDPDGKVLFQREFTTTQQNVPSWFQTIVDMPVVAHEQEMTDGWNILGTIHLQGHTGYAYQHLWQALRTEVALLVLGLIIMMLTIQFCCHRLLAPLRRASDELDLVSQFRGGKSLSIPWLSEVKTVVTSVNRLLSVRQRDLNQQRLKVQQLANQYPQPSVILEHQGEENVEFLSCQGDMLLYRAWKPILDEHGILPSGSLNVTSNSKNNGLLSGVRLPLTLLDSSDWKQTRVILDACKGRVLDWRYCEPTNTILSNLIELQQSGFDLAFHALPMQKNAIALFDLHPRFVSTLIHDEPLLWMMAAQCCHAYGITLICENGLDIDVDKIRSWGVDGYRKGAFNE
ncbi:MAG: LapD/MoxY N-terminal periplasmic domain-containing protein [Aeromonas veronii]